MKKNNFGFTLIELLAVVLMIGILTAVGLPQYRRSVQRAEAMEVLVNLRSLFDSAKRYRSANSAAPKKLNGLDVSFFDADNENASTFNMGKYIYTFDNEGIEACRRNKKAGTDYCMKMFYNLQVGSKYYKDLLACYADNAQGQYLCEALGTSELPDGTQVIGDTIK